MAYSLTEGKNSAQKGFKTILLESIQSSLTGFQM